MMGRRERDQGQLFYCFNLEEAVPRDHLVRAVAGVLDLSWVHTELAPRYSHLGRPSIDPVLMIRMMILGYVFAIRSERALCREVQVNLAYRWFCGLGIAAVVWLVFFEGNPLAMRHLTHRNPSLAILAATSIRTSHAYPLLAENCLEPLWSCTTSSDS
jgi:multidrug transporter EmrE-like cation transporter